MKKTSEKQVILPAIVRKPLKTSKSDGDQLLKAVLAGNKRRIRSIVNKRIPIDLLNSSGQTPLFCAVFSGKKDIVKLLLKLGAQPNTRCLPEGYTAMHGACYYGKVSILKLLLCAGGDLRLTDTNRLTPLDWIELQDNIKKRRVIRDFIELARFTIIKMKSGTTDSSVSNLLFKDENKDQFEYKRVSTWSRMINWFRCISSKQNNNRTNSFLIRNCQITFKGFGKVLIENEIKCGEIIGLPSVSEINDLKYDSDPNAPSWICGKFSTFIPMTWNQKNTSVSVKCLRFKSVEEAVPDILIAEVESLVKLHHPRILMILAVCQEDNFMSLSLVFEKITFGSLYFFLHNSNLRMKSSFATDMIIQISEALDYIHGCGYLHCGISSHAIMLVSENQAKLGCFEYAIREKHNIGPNVPSTRHPWLSSDSHLSIIRHWIAPEVLTKAHIASRASDVYSLCSVMWELVMGEVPWKDHSVESLRNLMKECPGLRLCLQKEIIPPYWLSVLTVGLKPKLEERDLDFGEIRYMMGLAKEKSLSIGNGSLRRTINNNSKTSIQSSVNDALVKTEDTVDAQKRGTNNNSNRVNKLSQVFQPPTAAAVIKRVAKSDNDIDKDYQQEN